MEWLIFGAIGLLMLLGKTAVTEVVNIVDKNSFYSAFKEASADVDWRGIPPSFALALSDLETGSGSGHIFLSTKNLFSLTMGSGSTPPGVKLGTPYTVASSGLQFRNYASLQDSMSDWVYHLHLGIYSKALAAALAHDFNTFAVEIKKAGYDATDPNYAGDLIGRYQNVQGLV